jgi:DNA (cytosine-5)-methyltransferase 1
VNHVSLFSGAGGLDLAAEWAGFETVLFCEKDPYCQKVLARHWPGVPIIDDIRSVNRESISGAVDVISGGPPCQPFSIAGKRGGTGDDRYLWPEMLRVIREIGPRWVVAENVPGLLSIDAGVVFETVLSDLERQGYETLPLVYPASSVGAPHKRDRVFIVAHAERLQRNTGAEIAGVFQPLHENGSEPNNAHRSGADVAYAEERGRGEGYKDAGGRGAGTGEAEERLRPSLDGGREIERGLGGMASRLPGWLDEPAGIPRVSTGDKNRVNRIKALGNAVVPAQAYPIFAAIAAIEGGRP